MKLRSSTARHLGILLLFLTVAVVVWKKPVENPEQNPAAQSPASLTGSDALSAWTRDLARAGKKERNDLIAEGVRIAERRVAALKELARTQPQLALAKTLSLDELALLPDEVRKVSEQPLNTIGSIDLRWESTVEADGSLNCRHANLAIVGDRSYPLLGSDYQSAQQPLSNVPLNGYILGDVLLLDTSPIRRLAAGEIESARSTYPAGSSGQADPVSGNPADPSFTSLIGGKLYAFENSRVLDEVAGTLDNAISLARESDTPDSVAHGYSWLAADSGAENNSSTVEATPFQDDTLDVLFVRVDFSDKPGEPITKAKLETDLATVKSRIEQFSHGNATVNFTVTPSVYRLSTNASVVAAAGDNTTIINETRAAAAANYTLSNYDVVAAYFPNLSSISGSKIKYGGLASVGGGNHWINGVSDSGRVFVITHEFGHNYGLYHANYHDPLQEIGSSGEYLDPANVSLEYGDLFDTMGGGSTDKGYFSPFAMSRMGWFASSSVVQATGSGTWRIYRYDTPLPDPTQIRALRIPMGGELFHWVGLRELYTSTAQSALIVNEGIYEDRPNLIDATPGSLSPESSDRTDAALPVGQTFTDAAAGVRITTTAAGGTAPNTWIDVQVAFDPRLELTDTAISVDESIGQVALVVSRTMDSSAACSVNYTTAGATATSGTDFHPASGTLSWAAGDSAPKTILIPIRPDSVSDSGETFTVTLSSPVNAAVPAIASVATVTILDAGQEMTAFDPPFFNSSVYAIAPLPDGKVIAGGILSSGITGNIVRLNADGSEDTSFQKTTGFDGTVYAIARQTDGKLVVGGTFTSYNGTSCNRIARLNANGSLDTNFNTAVGTGANGTVYAIALEPDGGIIIGGGFTTFASVTSPAIVRLLSTGARNTGSPLSPVFNSGSTIRIETLLLQSDGKIMIGGSLTFPHDGTGFGYGLARLNSNGTRDTTFVTGAGMLYTIGGTFTGTVKSIARTAGGQYLVGGQITTYKGVAIDSRMALINANGNLDTSFSPATSDGNIENVLIQANGRMLAAGRFTSPAGRITALTSTGATDPSMNFSGGAGGTIYTMATDNNGDIYIGGNFFSFAGTTSRPIVKVAGGVDPFTIWMNSNFTTAQIQSGNVGAEDDFDNDGILNVTEMALGTSPTTANAPGTFAVAPGGFSMMGGYLQASITRSTVNKGVWLCAQFSSNLSTWSPTIACPFSNATFDVIETQGDRFTVRDKSPSSAAPNRFVRFRAILPN
ncbi:MAG: Calx-beta domain-containing protein [Luteolibacter sp.]